MAAEKTKAQDHRAYLLGGDDDFRKARYLEKLLEELVSPDFADFDLEQMDGDTATCERVLAGLSVPALGSKRRVVLVKYANKMHPDEQRALASKLDRVAPSGCLILVNPAPEKRQGRPMKGTQVGPELARAVRKAGTVREFGGEPRQQRAGAARQFAQSLFAQSGKSVDGQVLNMFLQRVGSDFSTLKSEAQKLIDYAGDADRITSQDVHAVTSETAEEKVFKLLDAVGARNQSGALRLMGELFDIGEDPRADAPRTLSTIARQLRLVWQMKLLKEAGVRRCEKGAVPQEAASQLPSDPNVLDVIARQYWQEDRLARQAKLFARADLVRCFDAVARADMALKGVDGAGEDPRLVMEMLVVELARGAA